MSDDDETTTIPSGPIFQPTARSFPRDTIGALSESAEFGVIAQVILADGNVIHLVPLLFGQAKICVGPHGADERYTDEWQYETQPEAMAAFGVWVSRLPAQVEPEGWVRHTPSYRRRTHGDPSTETVRL